MNHLILPKKLKTATLVLTGIVIGLAVGMAIGGVKSIGIIQHKNNNAIALPSKVMDKNNRLITTFFSTENRTLIPFNEIPRILLQALITREDQTFFYHNGFSIRGTSRAAFNLLMRQYVSGGSTISQQVAGVLYADRREFSLTRKLKELWWSFQLERSWSKQKILAEYLNKMYFGHGNYGIETSSRFFFGHSARELTSAEAVMLVIQLASPVKYSPFKNPEFARDRQQEILRQMVAGGFLSQKTADYDFQSYWDNFDFTREGFSGAFLNRDDKAPYFTEYIRGVLQNELNFSNDELNTQGYTIYTTLDLDIQNTAIRYFDEGLARANRIYKANSQTSKNKTDSIIPVASLGMLLFGDDTFFSDNSLQTQEAKKQFSQNIRSLIALSNLFFSPSPNTLSGQVVAKSQEQSTEIHQEETVEGALITIDNQTHAITAMIGGSAFDATNQFNRAVNAFVQPGSSFKPLYYAAALDNRIITPSTIIWDSPVVFYDDDGNAYSPLNYKGEWKGAVTARTALAHSMNVPSLKVLDKVGFSKALATAGALLDMPPNQFKKSGLVPRYPVGLGIVSISPLAMAKAYATIENGGKKVAPHAIAYIKDRNGKTVYQYRDTVAHPQIISEQTAYVLTSILQTTTQSGTLAYARYQANGFTQPTAGKTGTTQNWSDSWTLGFTPYYTTALWFGFDRGGQSLGTNQTGAITTGPVWAKYMEDINKNLPPANFTEPPGIVTQRINPTNNTRATRKSESVRTEIYIAGTEPKQYDNPQGRAEKQKSLVGKLEDSQWTITAPATNTNKSKTTITRGSTSSRPLNLNLRVPTDRTLRRVPTVSSVVNKNNNSKNESSNDTDDSPDTSANEEENPLLN